MLNLLLIIAVSVTASSDNNAVPSLRVLGGRDARPDEYTFVVRIEHTQTTLLNTGQYFELLISIATGSMITPTWVLTCAHCIQNDVNDIGIRYGDDNNMLNYTDTRERKAVKLIVYPSYKPQGFDGVFQNDIALVMVERVPVTQLARLSMIEYNSLIGLPVKYAGYGQHKFDELNVTIPLQVGEGGVIPCDKELSFVKPSICVASKCNDLHQSVFFGDSGGPLFYDGRVVGVVAAGIPQNTEQRMTVQVFTPISPFIDWIESVIKT